VAGEFLKGAILGSFVGLCGAAAASLVTDAPQQPSVAAQVPLNSAAPEPQVRTQETTRRDADLVRDGDAPQVPSPDTETIEAAISAGSDTLQQPATGGPSPLEVPATETPRADLSAVQDATAKPLQPAARPTLPETAPQVTLSEDVAVPPTQQQAGLSVADEQAPQPPAASEAAETPAGPETESVAGTGGGVIEFERPDVEAEVKPEADPPASEELAVLDTAEETAPSSEAGETLLAQAERPAVGKPATSIINRFEPETETEEPVPEEQPSAIPLDAYAAEFENAEGKPLMSIILIDNGVNLTGAEIGVAALGSFPYPLTFAVNAALPDAAARAQAYRKEGFEVLAMIDLPAGATAADAEVLLSASLDAVPQAVGVIEGTGTGLQNSRDGAEQIAQALLQSGHGYVLQDSGLNTVQKLAARDGVAAATIFRDVDSADQTPSVIRRFLDQAAFRAAQEGGVIMLGRIRPDTISALLVWGLQDRATRVALAPVSAVLKQSQQ